MTEADVLRVIVTLIFIVMLILGAAWVVRRSGLMTRNANSQSLRLLATQNVGNRAWIAIVEVEDARLVVGVTAQQINLLHTLPPTPPESPDASSHNGGSVQVDPGFSAVISRALKRR